MTEVAKGDTQARIGDRIGITAPSVSRWAKGALPDPSTAASFARTYGRPVLEAFVAAGFLTPEEARQRPSEKHPIADYSDDELVEEVRRRMTREGGSNAQSAPSEKMASGVGRPRVLRPGREFGPEPRPQPVPQPPDLETRR